MQQPRCIAPWLCDLVQESATPLCIALLGLRGAIYNKMKTEGHPPGLEGPEVTLSNVAPLTQENINHSEKGAPNLPGEKFLSQRLKGVRRQVSG